ncbi:hypothetical protein K458DRAFT_312873 [Lentithecium fluviatile CBS 122367]|uniref:Rhodopsin domain-containing protein n=1 Tax=Lentithecium fluviatile CBS 122367 TaxID=1168545 RepID=A0A6G1IPA4_9PLEO|nr:hypothetical protein K458DRAFT_312873 [Lentithecium fluviatile CBS 122367]
MARQLDVYTTPALAAPPGVSSNLANPHSLDRSSVAIWSICFTLALSAVTARTFTKAYLLKNIQIEDCDSQVGFAAVTGVILAAERAGLGRHKWDISLASYADFININALMYSLIMFAAKFTVLIQIKRIFTAHQKAFIYWAVQVLLAANLLGYFAIFVTCLFTCWPKQYHGRNLFHGKCITTHGPIIATSIVNMVSDFTILFIPAFAITGLHMPWKRKVGVGAIFATGAFACASSIIRMVYSIKLFKTNDLTWALSPVGIWGTVEITTVILVAAFPTFPRLFKFLRTHDRGDKYVYKPDTGQWPVPARAHTSISTWGGNTTRLEMGSYEPLGERGLLSDAGTGDGQQIASPNPTLPRIYKKVEIEMVRRDRSGTAGQRDG